MVCDKKKVHGRHAKTIRRPAAGPQDAFTAIKRKYGATCGRRKAGRLLISPTSPTDQIRPSNLSALLFSFASLSMLAIPGAHSNGSYRTHEKHARWDA